jgi:hypothetical protein
MRVDIDEAVEGYLAAWRAHLMAPLEHPAKASVRTHDDTTQAFARMLGEVSESRSPAMPSLDSPSVF